MAHIPQPQDTVPLVPTVNTNFLHVWQKALDRYEAATGDRLMAGASVSSIELLLQETIGRKEKFQAFRHNKSKIDRLRTLLGSSMKHVDRLGEIAATAAKSTFPPAEAIFSSVRYLINIAQSITSDYDKLVEFFEDVQARLDILAILDSWVVHSPQLEEAATAALGSVLILFGMQSKYIKSRRTGKVWQNFVKGEDQELEHAHGFFATKMDALHTVINAVTMVGVEKLKEDVGGLMSTLAGQDTIIHNLDHNLALVLKDTNSIRDTLQRSDFNIESASILAWISSLSFKEKFERVTHLHGTGQWLLQRDDFKNWLSGSDPSVLWAAGIAGSGKTTLASMVVSLLDRIYSHPVGAVAYAFCQHYEYQDGKPVYIEGELNIKEPETLILRSILRQLMQQTRTISPIIKSMYDKYKGKNSRPTLDEQLLMLESVRCAFSRTFVVIDGLDEFPEQSRGKLLKILRRMNDLTIRLFLTSRTHISLQSEFISLSKIEVLANQNDLRVYLNHFMDHSRRMSSNLKRDGSLRADILRKLIEHAKGMFLLPELQIRYLCQQASPAKIRRGLDLLPESLGHMYQQTMERIADEDQVLVKSALSFVFYARRPLSICELQHALAIEDEYQDISEQDLPTVEILLDATCGMLKVDKEQNMALLVHETLQQFLSTHRELLLPENRLARTCIAYLSLEEFAVGPSKTQASLQERLNKYPFFAYAARHWGTHALTAQAELVSPCFNLFQHQGKFAASAQVLFNASLQTGSDKVFSDGQVKPQHAIAFFGLNEFLDHLGLESSHLDITDVRGATALYLAAQEGNLAICEALIVRGANVDIADKRGQTALIVSARNSHFEVSKAILSAGANAWKEDSEGWTALDWSIIGGNHDIVHMLIDHSRRHQLNEEKRNRAIILAAEIGDVDLITLLLQHGAMIDFEDSTGSTPLTWAVSSGHEKAVRLLLEKGASISGSDHYGNSKLHWAIHHLGIASILLEHQIKKNAQNHDGQTALLWCVKDGDMLVFDLLLEYEVDVDLSDKWGFTPLHAAAYKGNDMMIQRLLDHNANPNCVDKHGWTPLTAAAVGRHQSAINLLMHRTIRGNQIMQSMNAKLQNNKQRAMLEEKAEQKAEGTTIVNGLRAAVNELHLGRVLAFLEAGADIDEEDIGGFTALTHAVWLENSELVQVLLDHGANVNKCERTGRSALHIAAEDGCLPVMRLLCEAGADLELTVHNWTALTIAASRGTEKHLSSARYLLERGANLNAEDYRGRTTAHYAAKYGWQEILQTIIDAGVDPNKKDDQGKTYLIYAVKYRQSMIAKFLVQQQVNVGDQTTDGCTALHWAAWNGDQATCQFLLEHGAHVNLASRNNVTPLHLAAYMGFLGIVEQLCKAGADIDAQATWPSCLWDNDADSVGTDYDSTDEHESDIEEDEWEDTDHANQSRSSNDSLVKFEILRTSGSLDKRFWQYLADDEIIEIERRQAGCKIKARDIAIGTEHVAIQRLLARSL